MSTIAINVENLSKAYLSGQIGSGTLSHDFERWRARLTGKKDPYLRINETEYPAADHKIIWALKNISFEIEQGDIVGIIGHNGAGKSTLLKILSRITMPTTGKITGSGRITSLLEAGSGFHPELTGRENIYLSGAMLGMRKFEIRRKFDEITDFAAIETHLETPVKRYSSGMQMRLAFAVAAHLDSEILIVDEVLAVGDLLFQQKCLIKIKQISQEAGKTILLVSHNTQNIKTMCKKEIVLINGKIASH